MASTPSCRTFARSHGAPPRGGLGIDPKKTAVLFIEMQNEFATEGGKLHDQVRENMEVTGMLANAAAVAAAVRSVGVKVFHAPISFAEDGSDNPNPHLGILGGVDHDKLFTRGTWNAAICDAMRPAPEDVLIVGKRGLSAFPDTNLHVELKANGIETIALSGFMANCCVESTMREACEMGFNVVTLTDCVATTSIAGYKAATEITYPFFSTPMNGASFVANVKAAASKIDSEDSSAWKRRRIEKPTPHPLPSWGFREMSEGVYQSGPWFVDVRNAAIGGKVVMRSGAAELNRYLTFAEASGLMGNGICARCDSIYHKKMPATGESTEPFGWLCNMTVVRLPGGGCLVYSPALDADGVMKGVTKELAEHSLLPVRIVISPSPQHHLALGPYQEAYPDAFYICGKASGQMAPLTKKRREIRFDGALYADVERTVHLGAPVADREGAAATVDERTAQTMTLLRSVFELCIVDDNRSGEIVLHHTPSHTLIMSDLLYKSNAEVVGPGGTQHHYSTPEWFAEGQEELFYNLPNDNSSGLLPSYRTHPRMRSIDIPGMRRSLDLILAWRFDRAVACHVDPMAAEEARGLLKRAWAFVWD